MEANRNFENALQRIIQNISLSESEVRRNNEILAKVVDLFITEMRKDSLFEEFYERVFYGGSFYDGLRIGEPNEFDLDILLRIPERISATIDVTNIPGFVNCKIVNKSLITNKTFLNMINSQGYIEATLVRAWMESITAKALKTLCPRGELRVLSHTFTVTTRKSGPATTIFLRKEGIPLDIDFIPCFVFRKNEWPEGGYRPNPIPKKPEFFIVPKTPKRPNLPTKTELLWRLSFQEQEREMMEDKQFLKPALRLLKRLRDKQGHNAIASYYIKTIFLWEVEKDDEIFFSTLAECFEAMLDKYIEWLKKGEIPYFWNKKNDLLVGVTAATLQNYANRLKNIRRDGIIAYM